MTTTEHPEKRLLRRCEHPSTELCECRLASLAEVLARWPPGQPGAAVEQPGRDVIVLAEIRAPRARVTSQRPPLVIIDDDERHGDGLLGALGAWVCVAISVLLMAVLAARALWVWW